MITKRQRLINEVVEDLVATRTDVILMMKWRAITDSADLSLIMACFGPVKQRLVDMVEKAQETKDPDCPVYEWLNTDTTFRKVGQVARLREEGQEPQWRPFGHESEG